MAKSIFRNSYAVKQDSHLLQIGKYSGDIQIVSYLKIKFKYFSSMLKKLSNFNLRMHILYTI